MADNAPSTPVNAKSDDNIIAALATIPIVGLIIWFAMKDASSLVKFYAKQGTGLLIASVALGIIQTFGWIFIGIFDFLGFLSLLMSCVLSLAGLGLFVVWLILLIKALQGETYRVPFLSDTMDKILK
jgi:uncharacterized membrane protein